jgi:hypothetical protein
MTDLATIEEARRDPEVFASKLLKVKLFDHQLEVIRNPARYRVLCWGRRAGKTTVFGVLALWLAFSRPRSKIMIVSAGDLSVKRTHKEIAGMVTSAVGLVDSVEDDQTHMLRLSNGSTIESVPQSIRAVRSAEADLLVLDEAGFISQDVLEAVEPIVGARRGAKVLVASTPWGGPGHFFHDLFRQGMDRPDGEVWASHLPSTASPLINLDWLEAVKERSAPLYFAREYGAQWVDESGAYFTAKELEAALDDYALIDPDEDPVAAQEVGGVTAGIDWGGRHDANAVVIVGAKSEVDARGRRIFWVPWAEQNFTPDFDLWIDRIVAIGDAFTFQVVASEQNGIGMMPSAALGKEFYKVGRAGVVEGVTTTSRLKQDGFGFIKLLMAQRRLRLPRRHVELQKQLRSLEYEMLDSGLLRIAVPPNRGHDDLAMAFMLSVLPLMSGEFEPEVQGFVEDSDLFPELDDEMSHLYGSDGVSEGRLSGLFPI